MDFNQIKDQAPKSSGYLKLQDGDNKFRIVSQFAQKETHWVSNKSVFCTGDECGLCQNDVKVSKKFVCHVIDRADGEIKLAELGWSVVKQLVALQESDEYGFPATELPPFDLNVRRTGTGMDTEYSVLPARQNSELNPEEEKAVSELKDPAEIVEAMKEKASTSPSTEEKEEDVSDIQF